MLRALLKQKIVLFTKLSQASQVLHQHYAKQVVSLKPWRIVSEIIKDFVGNIFALMLSKILVFTETIPKTQKNYSRKLIYFLVHFFNKHIY